MGKYRLIRGVLTARLKEMLIHEWNCDSPRELNFWSQMPVILWAFCRTHVLQTPYRSCCHTQNTCTVVTMVLKDPIRMRTPRYMKGRKRRGDKRNLWNDREPLYLIHSYRNIPKILLLWYISTINALSDCNNGSKHFLW